MRNEILNKLNNNCFIYRNIQFWYENSDVMIYDKILRDFVQNLLDDVFYNISVDDLEKLLQAHKDKRMYNKFYQSEQTKELLNRLYLTSQEIQEITNKNVDNVLKDSFELFERIIF